MARHWAESVGGGLVGALLLVGVSFVGLLAFERPADRTLPHLLEAFILAWALIAIPLSAFFAWCELREETITLHEQLDRSEPRLFGAIKMLGKWNRADRKDAFYWITLDVWNEGAPSAATDFQVVSEKNGTLRYGSIINVTSPITVSVNEDSLTIRPSDIIYTDTIKPIVPGDLRRGHLVVSFSPEVPKETIRISFSDYRGKRYATPSILEAPKQDIETIPNFFALPDRDRNNG